MEIETKIDPIYYKTKIQAIDIIEANNLGFHEGNIIKYVLRYKGKNGIEDLYKAKWYLERLIKNMSKEKKVIAKKYSLNINYLS